jgi:xylulose-5-phosphate/fructose-6-phosphate phosphoketolase
MVVLNALDRFHLAKAVITRLPNLEKQATAFGHTMDKCLQEHHFYIRARGEDMPAIREWRWKPAISGNGA